MNLWRAITFRFIADLRRAGLLIWDAAHGLAVVWLGLLLVQGYLPVATVLLTRDLVNRLVAVKATGLSSGGVQQVLLPVCALAAVMLLGEVLRGVSDWVRTALSELIQDDVSARIHQRAVSVDLALYESSDYYDQLNRARSEASTRPLALLDNVGGLLQNGVTFAAMAAVLIPYGVWLPVVLVLSTVPALYIVFRSNRRYHVWWEETTSDRRLTQYYDTVLTHSGFAAELRLFDLGAYFRFAYDSLRARLRDERLNLLRDQSLARLGAGATGLVILGLSTVWMIARVVAGAASLGDLALFYQAFIQGQRLLQSLLSSISQMYTNSLFLSNLFEFLALQPRITDPPCPAVVADAPCHAVRFRNVTFRYPGSEREALKNFDLTIPAGHTVAIVGANGAGKSTLIKLLCRFYDPEAGRVEIDETDLRDLGTLDLRRRIAVLFQFPAFYQTTVAENVAVGNHRARPSRADIEAAARAGGAHGFISRLPRGYDTLLGKWFVNGTDLSGGEWQRIALSRAFLRQAPIVLLDEPTSFMDSWAEIEWLRHLRSLVHGRTTVIVTHRFTTAMHANLIHVMDGGRIVESGSHDQLIALGGLYAESWTTQMTAAHWNCAPDCVSLVGGD